MRIISEGNGGIQSFLAALLVVDGGDGHAVLRAANQARLLSAIARRILAHDRRLDKDT